MNKVIDKSPALLSLMLSACMLCTGHVAYADAIDVNIVYLEQQRERPPVLSNLVAHPEDEGEQGALLGIADNNTTGKVSS